MLQSVLRAACNDTWVLRTPVLVRHDVGAPDEPAPKPGDDSTKPLPDTPNTKARCEEMYRDDSNMEAVFTIWTMWDQLYPIGALPDAVCCRLERCPCVRFAHDHATSKWYGPRDVTAPSYFMP